MTPIAISVMILLFAWAVARRTRAWSHPAAILGAFWGAMTLLPLACVRSSPAETWPVAYILAFIVSFGAPAFLFDWNTPRVKAVIQSGPGQPDVIVTVAFLSLQACTLIAWLANFHLQGLTIIGFIQDPVGSAYRLLILRYEGLLKSTVFSQASVILNYIAMSLGGLALAGHRMRMRVAIAAIAFTPSLLQMIVFGDKGTLFLGGAYFFGGILAARIGRGDMTLVNAQTIKAALVALLLAAPVIIFAMWSRNAGDGGMAKVFVYLNSYAFGHLFAFSDWLNNYTGTVLSTSVYADPPGRTWGFWTFIAVAKAINPGLNLAPGYFTEYFVIPGALQTNIYTAFRGLIYDFGVAGSLVFAGVCGLAMSFVFRRMMTSTSAPLSQAAFITFVGAAYTSYIFSVFAWNSAYATALGLAALLFTITKIKSSQC